MRRVFSLFSSESLFSVQSLKITTELNEFDKERAMAAQRTGETQE